MVNFYRATVQAFENIRKGNKSTALSTLKIREMVSPTIWKGSKISHKKGKIISSISATGQQITSKIHHKIREIKTFMFNFQTTEQSISQL